MGRINKNPGKTLSNKVTRLRKSFKVTLTEDWYDFDTPNQKLIKTLKKL